MTLLDTFKRLNGINYVEEKLGGAEDSFMGIGIAMAVVWLIAVVVAIIANRGRPVVVAAPSLAAAVVAPSWYVGWWAGSAAWHHRHHMHHR